MTTTIRYVHANNFLDTTKCKYSGFTICYYRRDGYVRFSYSLCLKTDQYSKEIGRERSSLNLHEFGDKTSFDENLRCGILDVNHFKDAIEQLDIFSDQFVAGLTMYDFKHAAISKTLVDFVYGEAICHKYPNSKL